MTRLIALILTVFMLTSGCAAPLAPGVPTPGASPAPEVSHPHAPGPGWLMTETADVTTFHKEPLRAGEADLYQRTWEWVTARMGARPEQRLIIWLWSDTDSMYKWWNAPAGTSGVTGVWDPKGKRMHIARLNSVENQAILLAHELTHAIMPGKAPHWWFYEGYAVLTQERYLRELGLPVDTGYGTGYSLLKLQAASGERPVAPDAATFDRPFQTPWEIGLAVWLFVLHEHGQEGAGRLLAEGASDPSAALERLFGKPLSDIWVDWQVYLQSNQLMTDWKALRP